MKRLNNYYQSLLPERFNKDFIMSKDDDEDVLKQVKSIFKSLEIIDEVELVDIKLTTDESTFGPIKQDRAFYKAVKPSRLNKVTYKLKITPNENPTNTPAMLDDIEKKFHDFENYEIVKGNKDSFYIEKDLYTNKLLDGMFFLNEGTRYYLTYQVVDNSTYGTETTVSLKSLMMPITMTKRTSIPIFPANSPEPFDNQHSFELNLFSRRINPLLYVLTKYAYNALVNLHIPNPDETVKYWDEYRDYTLLNKFNEFFDVDIDISDDPVELQGEGRLVLEHKDRFNKGVYISVDEYKFKNNDKVLSSVIGSLFDIRAKDRKKIIYFTEDDFYSPFFWIKTMSEHFFNNKDAFRQFNKIKGVMLSTQRLLDESTKELLRLPEEDVENTLTVFRYMMREFTHLGEVDSRDLDNKRLRLYEYQLYPLRDYLSNKVLQVSNATTRSKATLDKAFNNLSPMYLIKQTVVNELLMLYNVPNEMNLFTTLLKYTLRGVQSLSKNIPIEQRDVHPSYVGRLSLIASSAGDPGLSGNISPFVEVFNGLYFKKRED